MQKIRTLKKYERQYRININEEIRTLSEMERCFLFLFKC